MMFGLCHFGTWRSLGFANWGSPQNLNWGSLGSLTAWGWIGLVLNLVFWIALLAGLALLVAWVIRRARVQAATVPYASGQPTAKEILQARYARGEITREQYERVKREIG